MENILSSSSPTPSSNLESISENIVTSCIKSQSSVISKNETEEKISTDEIIEGIPDLDKTLSITDVGSENISFIDMPKNAVSETENKTDNNELAEKIDDFNRTCSSDNTLLYSEFDKLTSCNKSQSFIDISDVDISETEQSVNIEVIEKISVEQKTSSLNTDFQSSLEFVSLTSCRKRLSFTDTPEDISEIEENINIEITNKVSDLQKFKMDSNSENIPCPDLSYSTIDTLKVGGIETKQKTNSSEVIDELLDIDKTLSSMDCSSEHTPACFEVNNSEKIIDLRCMSLPNINSENTLSCLEPLNSTSCTEIFPKNDISKIEEKTNDSEVIEERSLNNTTFCINSGSRFEVAALKNDNNSVGVQSNIRPGHGCSESISISGNVSYGKDIEDIAKIHMIEKTSPRRSMDLNTCNGSNNEILPEQTSTTQYSSQIIKQEYPENLTDLGPSKQSETTDLMVDSIKEEKIDDNQLTQCVKTENLGEELVISNDLQEKPKDMYDNTVLIIRRKSSGGKGQELASVAISNAAPSSSENIFTTCNIRTGTNESEMKNNGSAPLDPHLNESAVVESEDDILMIPTIDTVLSRTSKLTRRSLQSFLDKAAFVPTVTTTKPSTSFEPTPTETFVVSRCEEDGIQICRQCCVKRKMKYNVQKGDILEYICNDNCLKSFKFSNHNYIIDDESMEPKQIVIKRNCAVCSDKIDDEEVNLSWETLDFCNEFCLSKYQKEIGSVCSQCYLEVSSNALGKYCVRFGKDLKQFCSSRCLFTYKQTFKMCSYCHQDMLKKRYGFLAPVGEQEEFREFCSQNCIENFEIIKNHGVPNVELDTKCFNCDQNRVITVEYRSRDNHPRYFCGDACFVEFTLTFNITWSRCSTCRRYFPVEILEEHTMFYDNERYRFCSSVCKTIYVFSHRKIISCSWCKVKKYNFDLIRRFSKRSPQLSVCNINCLHLYQASWNALNDRRMSCNYCKKTLQPLHHLTMSDSSIRSFCSYCMLQFQRQFKLPIVPSQDPLLPRVINDSKRNLDGAVDSRASPRFVISNIQSLANTSPDVSTNSHGSNKNDEQPTKIKHHIIIKPPPACEQRNVGTICKVRQYDKSTNTLKMTRDKGIQTEKISPKKYLVPVPVPIYIPTPLPAYYLPTPYPLPIPIPIPVPIFIATTRNSAKGIMQEFKKIQEQTPTNIYEADLLAMADIVAGDKKDDQTDTESESEESPQNRENLEKMDSNGSIGEVNDIIDLALKMATDFEGSIEDIGGNSQQNENVESEPKLGQKRHLDDENEPNIKRLCLETEQECSSSNVETTSHSNSSLKYTYGVSAWKQWAILKNAQTEDTNSRYFKADLLDMTVDELNYSLSLFVKEVRKPSGEKYAPDTVYYLCLGIQQYLFLNNRQDNIFHDPFYKQFTNSLDQVARKFTTIHDNSQFIVTRVEEEHLWECKQLGPHSPYVLLNTLLFFNTKYFVIDTVEKHLQLSFAYIIKQWRKKCTKNEVPGKNFGSRQMVLKFYPPASLRPNQKCKTYELTGSPDNPLRCPVQLYEFYLSKCPESVRTRNDLLYLQPERSCVPESPLWYSSNSLPREVLEEKLNCIKMIKEVNVAIFAD